jgi:GNAT superfamily N-acetyltransferase
MNTGEVRAFMEWVIADRTARLMDQEAVAIGDAATRVRARISSLIDGPPGSAHHFSTLRAGPDADPLGWLWLSERRRKGARIATIEELVVFDDFRGRGLGASAVDSAIETVLGMGITVLEASIPVGNAAALAIARSCEFSEVDRTTTEVHLQLTIPESGR